jgi:hypothetical protein
VKTRTLALSAVAAGAVAAVVWWRRRSSAQTDHLVQLGLSDGSVRAIDRTDPLTIELQTLAAGVRDSFTGGA